MEIERMFVKGGQNDTFVPLDTIISTAILCLRSCGIYKDIQVLIAKELKCISEVFIKCFESSCQEYLKRRESQITGTYSSFLSVIAILNEMNICFGCVSVPRHKRIVFFCSPHCLHSWKYRNMSILIQNCPLCEKITWK